MRLAFLHIGVEKSGTTALQSALAQNRSELLTQGAIYPETPGKINHAGLALYCGLPEKHVWDLLPFLGLSREGLSDYVDEFADSLSAELAQSGAHTAIFSNEHLSSRVTSDEGVEKLAALMKGLFDGTKIVIYIRRQDQAILSEYSTWVQVGHTRELALHPHHVEKYDYYRLTSLWARHFGVENLILRIYERESLIKQDVVGDFFDFTNLKDGDLKRAKAPENESLGRAQIRFLRGLNAHIPANIAGSFNPTHDRVVKLLKSLPQGERLKMPRSLAYLVEDTFRESNERVRARYFGNRKALFTEIDEEALDDRQDRADYDDAIAVAAGMFKALLG